MGFTIGGIAIDHIVMGTFENAAGELVYTLSNLSEATVSVTSESKDITNAQGNLVRRVFRGKTGEVSATSAFIEMGLVASASGSDLEVATADAKIQAPLIKSVGKEVKTVNIEGVVESTVTVIGIAGNGAKVETYTKDTAAGDKSFAVATNTLTLPTGAAEEVVEFVIKCERNTANGLKVVNKGDKFPKAGKLTLMALAIDPCDKEGLLAAYIVCPNFQPSPDIEIALTNDGDSTLAYNGTLGVDQCSSDKRLYEVYLVDDGD